MSPRPLPVTVAAILLVLLALSDFPWLFDFFFLTLFPVGDVEGGPPAFILYSGIVLGIVGLVAAVGLWMMKAWSVWLTIVVCVLNILLNVSGLVMELPGGLKALIAVQTIGFVLTIVLVVLPDSRRAFAAS